MILPLLLTVLMNGAPVVTTHPVRIVAGRTMVPLVPVIVSIANVVVVSPNGIVDIERGRHHLRLAVRGASGELTYVPLAPIVRALGGSIRYDAAGRTVDISFTPEPLQTAEPYDMLAPRVAPTAVFTPFARPAPVPRFAGTPHPRRTPVEVRVPGL